MLLWCVASHTTQKHAAPYHNCNTTHHNRLHSKDQNTPNSIQHTVPKHNTIQHTPRNYNTHTHTHNMIIRAHTGTDLHIRVMRHNPTQHNMHTIQHTQHTTTNAYTCTQRAHFTQHTSQHSTPAHSTTRHNMQQKSPQVAVRVRVLCGVVCCGWGVF